MGRDISLPPQAGHLSTPIPCSQPHQTHEGARKHTPLTHSQDKRPVQRGEEGPPRPGSLRIPAETQHPLHCKALGDLTTPSALSQVPSSGLNVQLHRPFWRLDSAQDATMPRGWKSWQDGTRRKHHGVRGGAGHSPFQQPRGWTSSSRSSGGGEASCPEVGVPGRLRSLGEFGVTCGEGTSPPPRGDLVEPGWGDGEHPCVSGQ